MIEIIEEKKIEKAGHICRGFVHFLGPTAEGGTPHYRLPQILESNADLDRTGPDPGIPRWIYSVIEDVDSIRGARC